MIIIHLSDLHFERSIEDYDLHISKIADTLFSQKSFNKVVIIISGDIANKAAKYEYKAAKTFILRLKDAILKNFNHIKAEDVVILCVPGNHDINHNKSELSHCDLERFYTHSEYESELAKEIEKLEGFFEFSKTFDCYKSESLCEKKDIFVNGKKYSFYMINSAPFSLKKEEDKGLHYINEKSLSLIAQADGDYNIAIMHHSPYFYSDDLKNKIIEAFSQKFSLLMLGHEHYDSKEIAGKSNSSFLVFYGGALYNYNWNNSNFSIIRIYGEKIEKTNYKWNSISLQYECSGNSHCMPLPTKESLGVITVTDEYLAELKKDERKFISENFENYFIFPRMECIKYDNQNEFREITTERAFFNELNKIHFLCITGNHGLGKTTLLKHIFNTVKSEKIPLLLTVDDFRNKKPERVIKNAFEETYGNNPSIYELFLQQPSENKVLLIDDIDCINRSDFNSFILGIKDKFRYIILTSTEKIEFDWKDKLDQRYDYRCSFRQYTLTPLFKDKREDLVKILVPILKSDSISNNEEIIKKMCEVLDSQKRFVLMTPDFIIQYVDYFCKNIGDVSSYDTNTFSKVFEANIANSLAPNATGNINVDKIFLLLSKIAYRANSQKEYPIKEDTICCVISEYNRDYKNNIQVLDFINICKKSKVLYWAQNGYRFTSKNYLSYFIAREVLQIYNATHDESDILCIIRYCCFGINSDILLYIIYLSNNLNILNLILDMLNNLVDSWQEYDGNTVKLRYLEDTSKIKNEFLEKNSDIVLQEQVTQEKESEDIRDIQTIDIYDFDESSVDCVLNKIVRATSLLNLVARAFPNFEHMIKAEQKEAIVNMLYSVPNKIFYCWGSEIDNDCDGFIKYLLQKNDDEYKLNLAVSASIANMQNMSFALLLDLYYIAMRESCKSNTFTYIDEFEHTKKYTYQAEYLLAIEQYQKNPDVLIQLATKEIAKNGVPTELSKRILYHAINTLPKLNVSQKNKMASRIGLKAQAVKQIDINRMKGTVDN